MAANFTLTHKSAGTAQITSGGCLACVDQAPTGGWVAVDFGVLPEEPGGLGERVVHIDTTVALRFRSGTAAPGAGDAGSQMQAGAARTISFPAGRNLYIKS